MATTAFWPVKGSLKENISDGPEGIILESMLEGYAEYYSAELAQKIQRGQKENAMKCKNNGGNTPLGYYVDKQRGVLAVDPITAPIVQEIYTRYDSGERICEIRDLLNSRGLKTHKGKQFTVGGIRLILKNRKYIGEYKYGDVVIPDGIPERRDRPMARKYKYGNIDDTDYQKEIIDTFLNSIYVYDDRLVFTYNYRDGTETLALKDIEAAFGSGSKNCAPPH